MMFFNLPKNLPMNLEVVIIFKEQISKLYILAANLLTLGAKIWDLIQEKDKELDTQELPLSPL